MGVGASAFLSSLTIGCKGGCNLDAAWGLIGGVYDCMTKCYFGRCFWRRWNTIVRHGFRYLGSILV